MAKTPVMLVEENDRAGGASAKSILLQLFLELDKSLHAGFLEESGVLIVSNTSAIHQRRLTSPLQRSESRPSL